jgi:hypothetical protein
MNGTNKRRKIVHDFPPCECGGRNIARGGTIRGERYTTRYLTCDECGRVSKDVKINSIPILESNRHASE